MKIPYMYITISLSIVHGILIPQKTQLAEIILFSNIVKHFFVKILSNLLSKFVQVLHL